MRKVRRMIDNEKEDLKPRVEADQVPLQATAVDTAPDQVAEAYTMVEVERETTASERAAQSRQEQIKTLHKAYWRMLVLSFILLLLSIVLLRQT